VRAGTQALTLLSSPLNVQVLTALADEPRPLVDLRRAAGSPPQTTMRKYLQTLTRFGLLERSREPSFPGRVDYQLTDAGSDFLEVASGLQAWLNAAPDGGLAVGTPASKCAIKSFVDGWSSAVLRALAARALTLTELNTLIKSLNYPSLERRLSAMRFSGQIAQARGGTKGTPYVVTRWLRTAMGPLILAARWERQHLDGQAAPLSGQDVEALFLLSMPMMTPPPGFAGSCRFVVEMAAESDRPFAGVTMEATDGRIASLSSQLNGRAEATVVGPASSWLSAIVTGEGDNLELDGDQAAGRELLACLHQALFSSHDSIPGAGPNLESAHLA
jgi:DNA-binding HxlR family transcriptional regulator